METQEMVETNHQPMTVAELKTQINTIQQAMKGVMKENTHYGTIPGCGTKPTLLKPGAEVLMATFRFAAEHDIEDMSTSDEIRYRIKTRITHAPTTMFLGSGLGECSSNEEKYKWRKAVNDKEFESIPETHKRIKYGYKCEIQQVRCNPADIANTVLKMAKKRSLVDAVLSVTGASDMFTQDIEDMPKETLNTNTSAKTTKPPQRKSKDTETNEPQGFASLVTNLYPRKGKGPCSATFEGQEGYYKSFDEDMEMSLQDALDSQTKINITFHAENKNGYTSNMIDSLGISED